MINLPFTKQPTVTDPLLDLICKILIQYGLLYWQNLRFCIRYTHAIHVYASEFMPVNWLGFFRHFINVSQHEY